MGGFQPSHTLARGVAARLGQMAQAISVRLLMLPGLLLYGRLAAPGEAGGALPCLWRLWTGVRCPGCGLSRANHLLVHGAVADALAMNWLIVPVWLAAVHSFILAASTSNRKAHHG